MVINLKERRKTLFKEGLSGNIRYFKTTFIPYSIKPTDSTKAQIMKNATDVLCIKENTFEKIIDKKGYKIFKNYLIYMGILFDFICKFLNLKMKLKKYIKNNVGFIYSLLLGMINLANLSMI